MIKTIFTKIRKYFWNILIAIDQLFNTFLGGDPDETISSRSAKHVQHDDNKLSKVVCDILDEIDPNHCEKSIEEDEGKNSL